MILPVVGCGKRLPNRPSGLPETTPCVLNVTFGGEKIEGVSVLLRPKNKGDKWMNGGTTDGQGKARMKTSGYYDGVVPGEYTVSFRKAGRVELDDYGMPKRTYSLIPEKYTAGKSQETIAVTESQKEYTFELEGLPLAERQVAELLPPE